MKHYWKVDIGFSESHTDLTLEDLERVFRLSENELNDASLSWQAKVSGLIILRSRIAHTAIVLVTAVATAAVSRPQR